MWYQSGRDGMTKRGKTERVQTAPALMRGEGSIACRIVRAALLIVFLLAAPAICHGQGKPEVLKVEPPNWWAHHSINPVRVMIRGSNLTGARVEAAGPGIKTGLTRINAAGTYVFVDVLIDANATPGRRGLRITTPMGTTEASFEISAPLTREGR